jgi:hypothetical protein
LAGQYLARVFCYAVHSGIEQLLSSNIFDSGFANRFEAQRITWHQLKVTVLTLWFTVRNISGFFAGKYWPSIFIK